VEHARNRTTDLAEGVMFNEVSIYTDPERYEAEMQKLFRGMPIVACLAGTKPVEEVIQTLEDASLRGLGGAGFPTGRKWRLVRAEPAPRLMALNADEGEPGTFKDRYYLETDPHRVLEGMLIGAWAIEAEAVYIYLRDEPGFKRSSQHLGRGGCDGCSEAAFGSVRARRVALAGSALGCAA